MTVKRRPSTPDVVTLARPPLPLASGDTVAGRYVIMEHYGAGPLGHTYRAHDAAGVLVALKVVARELVPTHGERLALAAEVQKLVGREMSRVAVPLEAGIDAGVAYVVSPWVPGKSLRRVLSAYRDAGREITPEEARGVIEGTVEALRQVHAVCAHGALYPENIQLTREGRVVLTDAALAGGVSRARLIEHFERYPDVMPYLSPEVRGGKRPSAGSDLYSLGALASELLTGDAGATAAGIAGAMLPGAWPEVDAALRGLVDLKPSRRVSALPALLAALAASISARSVPLPGALPRQRQRTEVIPAGGAPSSAGYRRRR